RVVVHAGRDLLGVDLAVRVEQHDVGERAADVDADAEARESDHAGRLARHCEAVKARALPRPPDVYGEKGTRGGETASESEFERPIHPVPALDPPAIHE